MTDNDKSIDRHGFGLYLAIASAGALCLSLYFLAKSKAFAFFDVGADTFFCFYPLQLAIARQLHELHSLTWSFELGLGGFLGSLFDPLLLITGWLPESWQLSSRLPMFLLRLLLGGGFFYGYLRQIGFRAPLAVIGALGYTFSSYGLINAQWEVMHGTEFVQLAAYLFLLERYLHRGNAWAAISAGVILGLGHPLGLYTFALFSLIYASIRLATESPDERRLLFRSFFAFAAWCVLGLTLTAPLLFPAIYYLLESPRVSGDHSVFHALLGSLFSLHDRPTIASEIAGLLGKDLLGTGSDYQGWGNYFEAPGFYIGILPLLCIPQLFGRRSTRRERLLCLFGLICIVLYIIWPALRFAAYGFKHSSFRFSTLWISILLLLLGLAGLRRALTTGWWLGGIVLAVVGILCIAFGGTISIPAKVNVEHAIRIAAFTLLYAAVVYAIARASITPSLAMYLLLPIVACELLTLAIPSVIQRKAINADGSSPIGFYDDGTAKALEFIRQYDQGKDFYRIEKTFDSVFLDDPLAQNYSGTKSYYFHASSITRFVDRMALPRAAPSPNYISSMANRHAVLDLVGVKYLIARDRSLDAEPGMTYVSTASDFDIYKNESAHGFGHFYDTPTDEAKANAIPLALERDVFVRDHVIVSDPEPIRTRLVALDRSFPAQPSLTTKAQLRKIRDNYLEGSLETPKAQVLLLSMPFDRGWSATLDGASLDLFLADYGLTAALIPAGKHTLQLQYSPPGRVSGWWCAATAALLLLALSAWRRQKPAKAMLEPATP